MVPTPNSLSPCSRTGTETVMVSHVSTVGLGVGVGIGAGVGSGFGGTSGGSGTGMGALGSHKCNESATTERSHPPSNSYCFAARPAGGPFPPPRSAPPKTPDRLPLWNKGCRDPYPTPPYPPLPPTPTDPS